MSGPRSLRVVELSDQERATSEALTPRTTVAVGLEAMLTVRRVKPGPFTVRLTVVDPFGSWPTFAGGGANVP